MRRPEIVKRIKTAVSEAVPDAKVILYGSEARGDASPESDIDLLILVDRDQQRLSLEERLQIAEPLYNIEWETGVLINSIILLEKKWRNRPLKTPFYVNVVNEGVEL